MYYYVLLGAYTIFPQYHLLYFEYTKMREKRTVRNKIAEIFKKLLYPDPNVY